MLLCSMILYFARGKTVARPTKPKEKSKHRRMSFLVSEECDALLRSLAETKGISMTSVIEIAIRDMASGANRAKSAHRTERVSA